MSRNATDDIETRFRLLQAAWPTGSKVSRAVVSGVYRDDDTAVFNFYWAKDARNYGIRLSLVPPHIEFDYGRTLESWDEWIESFAADLLGQLDTGLVENSRRIEHSTYIELRVDESWPYQEGFDADIEHWAAGAERVRVRMWSVHAGPDKSSIAEVRSSGEGTGVLTLQEGRAADPHTTIDSVHLACHLAAAEGIIVISAIPQPNLDVIGFAPSATGSFLLELETSFIEEDFDEVRRRFV